MNKRDRDALGEIGKVDLNQLPGNEDERDEQIQEAIDFLEDIADDDKLSDWEYDFYESITGFIVRGYRLSDRQFEKLLQIKVKHG